jgi:hypothetical protein
VARRKNACFFLHQTPSSFSCYIIVKIGGRNKDSLEFSNMRNIYGEGIKNREKKGK